jgi:hypothetical protein
MVYREITSELHQKERPAFPLALFRYPIVSLCRYFIL